VSDTLRKRDFIVTSERARGMRPILRWIKEGAPHVRERRVASKLLSSLEGIKDFKQLILGKDEADMYLFVLTEFPEGAGDTGKQLSLFSTVPEVTLGIAPKRYGTAPGGSKIELPEPKGGRAREKPVLKKELTLEEEAERLETIRVSEYRPLPDSYFEKEMRARGQEGGE